MGGCSELGYCLLQGGYNGPLGRIPVLTRRKVKRVLFEIKLLFLIDFVHFIFNTMFDLIRDLQLLEPDRQPDIRAFR